MVIVAVVFINLELAQRTSVVETQSGRGGYSYTVHRTPARVISGRKVSLVIEVSKDGHPARNQKFILGFGHTYGIFNTGPFDPGGDKRRSTDENGVIAYQYVYSSSRLLPDNGYSIVPYPVETEESNAEYDRRLLEDPSQGGQPAGPNFDLTVWPTWLGWLVLF